MFVALVDSRRPWEPDPGQPEPDPRQRPHAPVRGLAWLAVLCWLLALGGVVDRAVHPLAGYAVVLLAVALGSWRLERWCARQYWRGLHEHQC